MTKLWNKIDELQQELVELRSKYNAEKHAKYNTKVTGKLV